MATENTRVVAPMDMVEASEPQPVFDQGQPFTDWQGLLPKHWPEIPVKTQEDLIALGVANLAALKREWRSVERSTRDKICRVKEQIDFLTGKTIVDLEELASGHEYPEFPSVGFHPDQYNGLPEPLDIASQHRLSNATTMNICGWCKYVRATVKRYNYTIGGSCELIAPMYFERCGQDNWNQVPEVGFDSPCMLLSGGQDYVDKCLASLKRYLKEYLMEVKDEAVRRINLLNWAMKQAEEKPCFVIARPNNWFTDHADVACLVHDLSVVPARAVAQLAAGKVSYASAKSWMLSVWANQKVHLGSSDGRGLNVSMTRPEVMLMWEYEYLLWHPQYRELWLTVAASEASEEYLEALQVAFEQELIR